MNEFIWASIGALICLIVVSMLTIGKKADVDSEKMDCYKKGYKKGFDDGYNLKQNQMK